MMYGIDILRLIGCTAATGVTGQSLNNKSQNALFDCGYIVYCTFYSTTQYGILFHIYNATLNLDELCLKVDCVLLLQTASCTN